MGKSHDLATFLDDGAPGDLVVDAGHQLRVVRPDGLTYGTISKGSQTSALGSGIIYNDINADGHHFKLGGVTKMDIDTAGRVSMSAQPSMFITGNWNAYQPADSAGRVRFNHIKAGHNDGFNTSTHTFTAPAAGKYLMNVYALIQTGANWEFNFYKNGSIYARCYTQGDRTTSGHVIMDMATNDYASIVCQTSIYLHQSDTYSGWTITKVA